MLPGTAFLEVAHRLCKKGGGEWAEHLSQSSYSEAAVCKKQLLRLASDDWGFHTAPKDKEPFSFGNGSQNSGTTRDNDWGPSAFES